MKIDVNHKQFTRIASAVLADQDEFFRLAMRNILSTRLGAGRIADAASLAEVVGLLSADDRVGLVLLDLGLAGTDGPGCIRMLRRLCPRARIMVMSQSRSRRDILQTIEAGAHGHVHKGSGAADMVAALRMICDGAVHVPRFLPDLPDEQVPEASSPGAALADPSENASPPRLSRRQREVLELLVQGMSNKAIARRMSLSEGAVKFHLSALFGHLGASNRVQAATCGARLLGRDAP